MSPRIMRFLRIASPVAVVVAVTAGVAARAYSEGESALAPAITGLILGTLVVLWLIRFAKRESD